MRKTRIFQNDAYITVDFLDKKTEITRIHDHEVQGYPYSLTLDLANGATRQITLERPEIHPINAIQTELESFYDSIIHNTVPVVSIQDGVKVLNLAYDIIRDVEAKNKRFTI